MGETDTDVRIFLAEVGGEALSAIDRAMLAAGAAEADHQAAEAAAGVCLHMRINYTIDMFKEGEHFPVIFQETYYRLIASGQLLVWLIATRIMD